MCWASLVAQTVKNPPATLETWVQSWGQEDRLEKEMATHEVRRRGQWASRGAPGKSGLHASGEGQRVIAPEPW